ncbi:hypothetical protein D3C72_2095430 [compost metagenome]
MHQHRVVGIEHVVQQPHLDHVHAHHFLELGGLQMVSVQHQADDGQDEQQQQTEAGRKPGSHTEVA